VRVAPRLQVGVGAEQRRFVVRATVHEAGALDDRPKSSLEPTRDGAFDAAQDAIGE